MTLIIRQNSNVFFVIKQSDRVSVGADSSCFANVFLRCINIWMVKNVVCNVNVFFIINVVAPYKKHVSNGLQALLPSEVPSVLI